MSKQPIPKMPDPVSTIEHIDSQLSEADLNDLCDATDAAIANGGGFGWVEVPARDILERYWQGVVTMPGRMLFVARLDGVICGACQLVKPPANNEAQGLNVQMSTTFITPWARGHQLATQLVKTAEDAAQEHGFAVMNLDVRETAVEAIRMYEKLGYIRVGMHPYYAQVRGETLRGYYYYKVIDTAAVR